jgi:hypothetical protein
MDSLMMFRTRQKPDFLFRIRDDLAALSSEEGITGEAKGRCHEALSFETFYTIRVLMAEREKAPVRWSDFRS